jgi:hypothetical protein
MLCGGISIVGLFYSSPAQIAEKYQGSFQTIASTLVKEDTTIPEDSNSIDFAVMTIGTDTKKYNTQILKIQNSKVQSTIKSTDYSIQPLSNIQCFTTVWSFNSNFLLSDKESLKAQIEQFIEKECSRIRKTIGKIGDEIIPQSSLNVKWGATQKTDKKKKPNKDTEYVEQIVKLLSPGFESLSFYYPDTIQKGYISLQGAIHSRSYFISEKPTYNQIFSSLKSDIITSLTHRLSIWYEDLENTDSGLFEIHNKESSLDSQAIWTLPRRVFVSYRETPILVCDYVQPSEETSDVDQIVADRNMELLQNKISPKNSIQTQELQPKIPDIKSTSEKKGKESTADKKKSVGKVDKNKPAVDKVVEKKKPAVDKVDKKQTSTEQQNNTQEKTASKSNIYLFIIPLLIVILAWLIYSYQ